MFVETLDVMSKVWQLYQQSGRCRMGHDLMFASHTVMHELTIPGGCVFPKLHVCWNPGKAREQKGRISATSCSASGNVGRR